MKLINEPINLIRFIHNVIVMSLIFNIAALLFSNWFIVIDRLLFVLLNTVFVLISCLIYTFLIFLAKLYYEKKDNKTFFLLYSLSMVALLISLVADIIIYVYVISNNFSSLFILKDTNYIGIALVVFAMRLGDIIFYHLFYGREKKR